ncbi:MAG TPA: hypothetical protein VK463_20815 [Desulfomonilaceae bacterium]|nr:hypothetical protein [Desulfomonilaceae bacterium]
MVNVELNDTETKEMKEILEIYLHELTSEIASTDTLTFRQDLKKKKMFVMDMLDRLTRVAA